MTIKDTTLIIYPTGGYGTYFEWCLSYFTGLLKDSDSPLMKSTGSAHKFWGNPLDFPKDILGAVQPCPSVDEYLDSENNYVFARTHARVNLGSAQLYVDKYGDYFKHIIHLRHSKHVILEVLLNRLHKVFDSKKAVDDFYKQANVLPTDAIWEAREKISFTISGLYNHYDSERGDFTAKHAIDIPIERLKDEFRQVITEVVNTIGLELDPIREQELDSVLKEWKHSQKFLGIDQMCLQFVNAAIKGEDFDWDDLPHYPSNIVIEAYIQMLLRDLHRYEIRCYNLDVFPTNTKDLKELLINV